MLTLKKICWNLGVVCFALIPKQITVAAEVDTFTGQEIRLPESRTVLNHEVNRRLERAIQHSNKIANRLLKRKHPKTRRPLFHIIKGITYCNKKYLMNALEDELAGPIIGELEQWAETTPLLTRHRVAFQDSIYQDFLLEETPTISGFQHIAAVILLNNYRIGTDKLGHFFTEGKTYYDRQTLIGEPIESTLTYGEKTEIILFGTLTTGVYSFADLSANFHGLRFWSTLLEATHQPTNLQSDLLKEQDAPYVRCEQNEWRLVRAFDWADYIDATWDESINCNHVRNQTLLNKINSRLALHPVCSEPAELIALKTRYGKYYDHLVNTNGLQVIPDRLQAYVLLDHYIAEKKKQKKPKWFIKTLGAVQNRLKSFIFGHTTPNE